MLRRASVFSVLVAVCAPAAAQDVWMVRSSGVLGCTEREALVAYEQTRTQHEAAGPPPRTCVVLYSGERLIDQPEIGVGFNEHMRVERSDRSIVFVRRSDVVPDPGIGSVTEDRF